VQSVLWSIGANVNATPIFTTVDLIGVFVGALSGALVARSRTDFDVIGVGGLALASGIGGGLIRDVLLQQGPPLALTHIGYLIMVFIASLIGFLFSFSGKVERPLRRALLVIDAIALGDFAVAGTLRALDAHLGILPAILLGIIGATGGGILRDLLLGIPPVHFQKGNLYVVVAIFASMLALVGIASGMPRLLATMLAIVLGAALRILSLRFGWTAPQPLRLKGKS
jgi:uncharacterized membrane protein YeiH